MSEVHRGARICGDLTFFNHHLISAVANKQMKTKSTDVNRDSWIIETNIGTVDLREHKYILINQQSASAGDAFLSLQTRSGSLTESHQFKALRREHIIYPKRLQDGVEQGSGR
jgi:hypothetical protein